MDRPTEAIELLGSSILVKDEEYVDARNNEQILAYVEWLENLPINGPPLLKIPDSIPLEEIRRAWDGSTGVIEYESNTQFFNAPGISESDARDQLLDVLRDWIMPYPVGKDLFEARLEIVKRRGLRGHDKPEPTIRRTELVCTHSWYDTMPDTVLTSNPPKKRIRCSKCGERKLIFASEISDYVEPKAEPVNFL